MKYSHYEKEQIKTLGFYSVLEQVDDINNFANAERNMKYERNKYLKFCGGFELWKQKYSRCLDDKLQ